MKWSRHDERIESKNIKGKGSQVVGKRGGSRPNFWQPAAHVIYGPKLGQVTLTHAPPAVSDVVELSRTACLDSRAPCDASRRLFIA